MRPWIRSSVLMMIPAPKKPMPTAMLAITVRKPLFRATTSGRFSGEVATRWGRARATMVKMVEPEATSIWVLMPASLPADSLSMPINKPKARAITNLASICSRVSIYI